MIHPYVVAAALAAGTAYYHLSYFKSLSREDIEAVKTGQKTVEEIIQSRGSTPASMPEPVQRPEAEVMQHAFRLQLIGAASADGLGLLPYSRSKFGG